MLCFVVNSTIKVVAMGVILFAMLPGCQSAPSGAEGPPRSNHFIAGLSVQKRPIECHVLGHGPDVVMIVGTIHGDEAAGTALVRRLSDHLLIHSHRLAGRQVVLVPVANPDGMLKSTRGNANGVDLNRNFPAANRTNNEQFGWSGLSEPESQALAQLMDIYQPDRIVVMHQPLGCIDYDGPAEKLARRMGDLCNLPVKKLGTRPGSMGAFVGGDLGVPIITFELPRAADKDSEETLWEKYGNALMAAVVFPDEVTAALVMKK
ncbi:MAG: DUF2817 domain-containing protein [Phycisphaeraceae bacterium]